MSGISDRESRIPAPLRCVPHASVTGSLPLGPDWCAVHLTTAAAQEIREGHVRRADGSPLLRTRFFAARRLIGVGEQMKYRGGKSVLGVLMSNVRHYIFLHTHHPYFIIIQPFDFPKLRLERLWSVDKAPVHPSPPCFSIPLRSSARSDA